MFVYSKKIIQFTLEIKSAVKLILAKEVYLKVRGERFYDKSERFSYPIKILIFNHQKTLGYFNPDFYELGFNESLMHSNKTILYNVIRHEIAHYLTFIEYGDLITIHGAEFKSVCNKLGWGKEIYEASIYLSNRDDISDVEKNPVLRKVQKLLALSSSSSQNEAEQALIKSRELLLKHNISSSLIEDLNEEKMYLKRIMKQKKKTAKMVAIARILDTFFVNTVFHKGVNVIYLEILGEEANIEIAEYIASVLDVELDHLWTQAKLKSNLHGLNAKNSFFLGLSLGYCKKVDALKREYKVTDTKGLLVIEKKLTLAKELAYGRLTQSKSSGKFCQKSAALGEQMGKALKFKPAVTSSQKNQAIHIQYSNNK